MSGRRRASRVGRPERARPIARGPLAYLEVGLAALAPATAGLLYNDYFTSRGYLPALLGAAAAGAVLATVAAIRRWPALVTVPLLTLGFAALATFVLYTPTLENGVPTLETARALGSGLLHGWIRMFTVSLPADPDGDLLVTPALLAFAAAGVATTLVLRTRVLLVAVVPPVLAFGVGLLYTAHRVGTDVVVTAAFLVEALVLVAVRVIRLETADASETRMESTVDGPAPRRRRGLGRLLFAVPAVLVVAGLGVVGNRTVPVATGTHRFDPRAELPLPYVVDDTLTPLVTLKSQLRQQPPQTLFTARVTGDADAPVDRLRTAALDTFDGALWTADDSFLVAGHTLAPDPAIADPVRVSVQITVDGLSGPYLPAAGWPVRVGASGLGFSAASGVLVSNAPSVQGLAYDVTGEVRPRDDGLRSAIANLTADTQRYVQLPAGLPQEMDAEGKVLAAQGTNPFAKLTAIETYLRKLPYSLEARPGHSYDALRRLFGANPQDRIGYAEQYASAFAVLARVQGFPTRVAVGYLLRPQDKHGDTYTVTTADAHAWPEVALAGYGWVSFEPTDFTRTAVPPQAQPSAPPGATDRPADQPNPGAPPLIDPGLSNQGGGTAQRVLTYSLIVLVVLALLLFLTPLAIAFEKIRRRRRRRRRGSQAGRIIGAWRDTADRLVEHGVAVPGSMTAQEVSVRAQQELGEPAGAVAVLAPLVTAAVFSPAEPGDDAVREAWEINARVRRDLRRGRGVFRAVRARFDPRPLVAGSRDRKRSRRALDRLREDPQ